jgi:hypothetical protein
LHSCIQVVIKDARKWYTMAYSRVVVAKIHYPLSLPRGKHKSQRLGHIPKNQFLNTATNNERFTIDYLLKAIQGGKQEINTNNLSEFSITLPVSHSFYRCVIK